MRKPTFLTLLPFSIALALASCGSDEPVEPEGCGGSGGAGEADASTDVAVPFLCDKKDTADCDAGTNDQ